MRHLCRLSGTGETEIPGLLKRTETCKGIPERNPLPEELWKY
jgi:hypothetical protein